MKGKSSSLGEQQRRGQMGSLDGRGSVAKCHHVRRRRATRSDMAVMSLCGPGTIAGGDGRVELGGVAAGFTGLGTRPAE